MQNVNINQKLKNTLLRGSRYGNKMTPNFCAQIELKVIQGTFPSPDKIFHDVIRKNFSLFVIRQSWSKHRKSIYFNVFRHLMQ